MSIAGLVYRLVKGTALTAAEHDANLEAIEDAVDGKVEGTAVTAIVSLTYAEYLSLSPPSATTLYVISDAGSGATSLFLGVVAMAARP